MTVNQTLPTKERILIAAQQLILTLGFSGMTVEAVCNATGLTKGGLFHHFSSKDALGEAVLDYFWQAVQNRQQQAVYHQATTQREKILGYIDQAIEDYQQPQIKDGCLLAIFTMELSQTYPALYQKSVDYFQQWRTELIEMLQLAADEAKLKDFDALAWGELLITTVEGSLLLAKAQNDKLVTKRTLSLYKRQLDSALSAQ